MEWHDNKGVRIGQSASQACKMTWFVRFERETESGIENMESGIDMSMGVFHVARVAAQRGTLG